MDIVHSQVVVVTTDPLAVLAAEINEAHDAATAATVTALEQARKCGELLIKAKADVGHGGWLPWLKSNCRVKERQARNYMRLSSGWEQIKSAPGAEMTIKGALKLIDDGESAESFDLVAEIHRVGAMHQQVVEMIEGSEHKKALVEKYVTLENVQKLGWEKVNSLVADAFTATLAKELELRTWIEEVGKACNERMAELSEQQFPLPNLEDGYHLTALGDKSMAWVTPIGNGYFYVGIFVDLDGKEPTVTELSPGVAGHAVNASLKAGGFIATCAWQREEIKASDPPTDEHLIWAIAARQYWRSQQRQAAGAIA